MFGKRTEKRNSISQDGMMRIGFIYHLLTSPVRTMMLFRHMNPLTIGLGIVFLSSLSLASVYVSGPYLLSVTLWFMIGFCVWTGIQAMVIDFGAQLFGYEARSFPLFSWLCCSLIPLILAVPFSVIRPFLNGWEWVLGGGVGVYILGFQLMVIKTLYEMRFLTGVLVYFWPFLLVSGLALVSFVVYGFSVLV